MESLGETVMHSWLAASGALVAFVIFTRFKAARTAATGRMHHHRRVT